MGLDIRAAIQLKCKRKWPVKSSPMRVFKPGRETRFSLPLIFSGALLLQAGKGFAAGDSTLEKVGSPAIGGFIHVAQSGAGQPWMIWALAGLAFISVVLLGALARQRALNKALGREVEERKRAEAELQKNEELLRSAIDAVGEAFVVYDEQDRLVTCNSEYKATYSLSAHLMEPGRTFEELLRHGVEHGQFSDARGREEEWIAERVARHRRGNTDINQRLSNGRWLRILERKTPMGHVVGFRFDITALMQAKEAAEAGNRAKNQFLASMSHELRTPLNAVLGYSQLLSTDDGLPEAIREQVREVERAGNHLLALVNDVLDLSRIDSGNIEFAPRAVTPGEILSECLTMLRIKAQEADIELIDDGGPAGKSLIYVDPLRLRQALINLISNAIKYNRRGGQVRLQCFFHEEAVRIAVADTGKGIPADKQGRIFTAFDRLDAEFGTVEGTGIGLVIAKRIVETMGGTLGFESVEGHGSTFWVEFMPGRLNG